ncbi:MAG: T9SS type A sorting domain-containing protein [Bacteroidetes bacterium]|nr:T9SS type A sorting domain-containing protein [Bacteroidota bacterium]
MRTALFILLLLQSSAAQWQPAAEFILGDTASHLEVTGLCYGANGTVFATGQHYGDSIALYLSALTPAGQKLFEHFRVKGFDEKGLIIRPYDADRFIIVGHSEDTTGTFNVRLVMMGADGTVQWETTFGNDGMVTMEIPKDVAVDQEGNIIIGGITFSSDVRSLLLKFSPTGTLLWSRRSAALSPGNTTLHDVEVGTDGAIYGLSANTFVADSSNGTVTRWDAGGTIQWSRNFDLSFTEERAANLLLSGDTLFIAGSPFITGTPSTAVTLAALKTDGELLRYRTFPLHSNQQSVRDFRLLPGGVLALLDETFLPPHHRLHTMLFTTTFTRFYHDSLLSSFVLNGQFSGISSAGFSVVRHGAGLSRVHYALAGTAVTASAPESFDVGNRFIDRIAVAPPHLAAAGRVVGSMFDRVHVSLFTMLPAAAPSDRNGVPASYEVLSAYPNPFNPSVTLRFRSPADGVAELTVYDLLGRTIAHLLSGPVAAGTHSIVWDAADRSAGPYLARLRLNGRTFTTKLLLAR